MTYESNVSESYKPENYSDHAIQGYVNLKNNIIMPYVYQYTHMQVPPCYERYFIIKPKLMSEVIFSLRHNYWHVNKRHSDYLNRLFEVS
jgi:hypothetical protein